MSRSPRMSCSVISATSAVSKPDSSAEHGKPDLHPRQRQSLRPGRDRREIMQSMLGEHVPHALARAFAPQRDQRALAVRLQRADMLDHGLEHIGAGRARSLAKLWPAPRADFDDVRPPPPGPARQTASAAPAAKCPGARAIRFRRDKAGRAAAAYTACRRLRLRERILACLVIVGDLRRAAHARLLPPAAQSRSGLPADNRTACRAGDETAAANAPCRHSGVLRSPLRRARRPGAARRIRRHSRCGTA